MKKKVVIVLVLVAVVSIGALVFLERSVSLTDTNITQTILNIGSKEYVLDVVDTPAGRSQGLSGRENLLANTGMLFVFEQPDFHGIWMKDMNFDIDILWLDNEKRVIYVKESVTPDSYPSIFYPREKASYVIEVSAGEVSKQSIQIGDMFKFKF